MSLDIQDSDSRNSSYAMVLFHPEFDWYPSLALAFCRWSNSWALSAPSRSDR